MRRNRPRSAAELWRHLPLDCHVRNEYTTRGSRLPAPVTQVGEGRCPGYAASGRRRAWGDAMSATRPLSDQETIMRRLHLITPLLLGFALAAPVPAAQAQVAVGVEVAPGVSITIAPPFLPIYAQPEIPAPGYIWTPGYWAYGPDGYYWVPGTWILPPAIGLLWTPGYSGW